MSQTEILYSVLKDGMWHRTDELLEKVYGGSHLGLARLGARCFDLKKRGFEIESRPSAHNRILWEYKLKSCINPGNRTDVSADSVLPSCCVPLVFKVFGNYKSAVCPRCKNRFHEKVVAS